MLGVFFGQMTRMFVWVVQVVFPAALQLVLNHYADFVRGVQFTMV